MTTKTLIERNGSSIIYRCATGVEIPDIDMLTLLFDHPSCLSTEDTQLHLDAANPSLSLNKSRARDLTRRLAHSLRTKFGIGSNGTQNIVTAISSGNYVLPACFYGVVAAGGIFSPVSAASTPDELGRLIKAAPSELIICNADTKATALAAAKKCGIPTRRVLEIDSSETTGPALRRCDNGENILGSDMLDWRRITDRKELETTAVTLIYSSGTTGLPKGVPLSHRNMVSAAAITRRCFTAQVRAANPEFEFRTLAHLPAAHIAGVLGYFLFPFYSGGPTFWMRHFSYPDFLAYNKKYRITFFFTVPPIYLLIAKDPNISDHFDHLEIALSGAAPLGKELQNAASKKLGRGKTFISQTWGLSENTGSATLLPFPETDDTGSVSRLIPNVEARILDDDGKDVEVGKPGELCLRGPIVFRGYHNNPEANQGAFLEGGWFCTGDIGLFDEKTGLFYIVDRKKELIKYKGLQVAPAELEALLLSNPKILDAAVIGVDSPDEGTEVPRAYVIANKNEISETEIKDFVKQRAAGHKQLRGGVVFVTVIPKSPSGKILRKDLRMMAKAGQRKEGSKL